MVRPIIGAGAGVRSAAAEHLYPLEAVGGLTPVAGPAGVALGHDSSGAPVRLRLFRPEPTRVTLVGGLWATRLLMFRCLALGARVVVRSLLPQQWLGLDGLAGGRGDRVWPVPIDQPVNVPADDTRPVLYLYDTGAGALGLAEARPVLGAWQTQLVLLEQLPGQAARGLTQTDVVLVQRLTMAEATLAANTLGLSDETAGLLQALHDDMLAVIGGRADRYTWLSPTSVEGQLFGPPQRGLPAPPAVPHYPT